MSQPLLFLGCSLRHDRVVRILQELAQELAAQHAEALQAHYAVVERPVEDDMVRARERFLGDLGVRPIWYPPGRHDLIENVLTYLAASSETELIKDHASATGGFAADDLRARSYHTPRHGKVRERYLGYLERHIGNRLTASIHSARMLDINSEERPGATLPWGYTAYADSPTKATFDSFAQAFEFFRGRVLLLGTPGSGKTVTLQHFAMHLASEARLDDRVPVPLFFNLSTFRPGADHVAGSTARLGAMRRLGRQPNTFEGWLVDNLTSLRGAGVPREVAEEWVASGAVTLLLDGLDEVNELYVRHATAALNRTYLEKHPDTAVVIASRLFEYQPLEDSDDTRLWLEGGVVLQPLSDEQVGAYLAATQAIGLRNALPSDQVLQEMARSPLTLSMMVLAYGGLTPDAAKGDLPHLERRRELLDTYVDKMMQRHARRKLGIPFDTDPRRNRPTTYDRRRVNSTLGWIAVRLSERSQTLFPAHKVHAFLFQTSGLVTPRFWSTSALIAAALSIAFALLLWRSSSWSTAPLALSVPLWLVMMVASSAGFGVFEHLPPRIRRVRMWVLVIAMVGLPWLVAGVSWQLDTPLAFSVPLWVVALVAGSLCGLAMRELDLSLPKGKDPRYGSIGVAMVYVSWAIGAIVASVSAVLPLRIPPAQLGFILAALYILLAVLLEGAAPGKRLGIVLWSAATGSVVAWLALKLGLFHHVPTAVALGAMLGATVAAKRAQLEDAGSWLALSITVPVLGLMTWGLVALVDPVDSADAIVLIAGLVGALVFSEHSDFRGTGVVIALIALLSSRIVGPPHTILLSGAALLFLAWRTRTPVLKVGCWVEESVTNLLERVVLWARGAAPLRFRSFLDYCTDATLLKKTSGEYEFVHRLLRDHFAIRDLLHRLSGASGDARLRIIEQLSLQGESSFDALSNIASHQDEGVRAAAAMSLGRVPSNEVPALLKRILLEEPDARVRIAAVEGTGPLAEDGAADLLDIGWGDSVGSVRRAVIRATHLRSSFGWGEQYLGFFRAALLDSDSKVTREALAAIGASYWQDNLANLIPRPEVVGENAPHTVIDRLITNLEPFVADPSPEVRRVCVELLGLVGRSECVERLDRAATDPDRDVRAAALRALGKCGTVSVLARLVSSLKDLEPLVRAAAAGSLSEVKCVVSESDLRAHFVPALCGVLADADRTVRSAAALALADSARGPALVDALLGACRRGTPNAPRTLCSLKGVTAADVLKCVLVEKAMPDSDEPPHGLRSRDATSEVFRWLRMPEEALDGLRSADVKSELFRWLRNGNCRQRQVAAWLFGQLKLLESEPLLIEVLRRADGLLERTIQWLIGEGRNRLANAAARSLGDIGGPSSLRALEDVARDGKRVWSVRRACIEALGNLRTPSGVQALCRVLEHAATSVDLTRTCLTALGETGCPEAAEIVERAVLTNGRRQDVAETAANALGKLGASAVGSLVAILETERDLSLRAAFISALGQTRTTEAAHALVAILEDGDTDIQLRIASARAVGQQSVPDAARALARVASADQVDEELVLACVDALGKSPAAEAILLLAEATRSNAGNVKMRWLCERILWQLECAHDVEILGEAIREARASARPPQTTCPSRRAFQERPLWAATAGACAAPGQPD